MLLFFYLFYFADGWACFVFFFMDHLSGLSLDTSFHQLSTCRIHSQLSRDVHSPVYQHSLAGRQKGTRLAFWVLILLNDNYTSNVEYSVLIPCMKKQAGLN